MKSNSLDTTDELREKVDLFLSKWKLILISVLLALAFAFLHLRYATYQYQATTSIKLTDEKQSKQLPELTALQDYGMFSSNFNNVEDEAKIITSRKLVRKVVEELKLNIRYYVRGNFKDKEIYKNPPVILSYFESDSIINKIDTVFYLKIKTKTKFLLSSKESNELLDIESSDAKEFAFGDRISTGFGDLIITPNIGKYEAEIGRSIKIKMTPIKNVVEVYQQKIKVSTITGSNIITISIKENLSEKAELVLDKIVEKYNDDVIHDKQLIVETTSDFINNRLNIVSNELEQVDFTAESLQKNNRLTALSSQANIFLQTEKENESRLIATTNQIQLIDYMKDHLSENNANSDFLPAEVGIADGSVSQITNSHNALVMQRNRILKNSSEKNPTVINLNNQISSLKENLSLSLENIKSAQQITLNSLKKEDARISSQLYSAPSKERKFRDIKRQQDIKESLYLYLLQKREEMAITQGISKPNAKIIDEAYSGSTPVNPKPNIVYLAALLLGLIFPVSFIYLKDMLDTKIHSKKDLFKIVNLPFIGDIPKSSNKNRLINKVDYSPKAEAFRIIRSNINFMLKENNSKSKTVFVTSTTSQEGKSHTAINLASSFSFSEKKTLIIETDIRVPRVNEYLNIKADKGLTDYISDSSLSIKDVTVSVKDNEFLDIIPSGTIPPNPAELLMSDRVTSLFESVKQDYDYIIVDTAAVGLVTDTFLISDNADMVIYVISVNNIDKREIHLAQTLHDEKRLPNIATLLNGTIKKKGYGYGYGSAPIKKKWWKFK